jgi:tRNA-2-methylthio-N6-dimethylallyladenosine synthase
MPRIYIETFGCQMNEADSQFIADRAVGAGYAIATRPEEANVVVLNTCTVRDNAERRAYGRMHHLKLLKERDPAVRLVVTGCLAEQDRDRMHRIAPHVDAVFGTKELGELADRLGAWCLEYDDVETVDDETLASEAALVLPMGGTADGVTDAFSHLRAFVTVQRGCSYYCTFCIVPHVRGRFDHRPMHEIVRDVRAQVTAGAREIMLVGQTVNAWRDADGNGFGDLLHVIAGERTASSLAPERLTFISPHPKDFTEAMIAGFAEIEGLNPRIHLPLQSGSDRILRRMNRKYARAQFEERVAWIRRYLPDWAITTDLIVGFPGESEEDFLQTLELVRDGTFANAFTFIYSPRRGTPAAQWEQVPREVSAERFRRLAEAQNAATRAYHERKTGTTLRALITGTSKRDSGKLCARATDNVTVIAPKPIDYDEDAYAREPWLDVRVETAHVWGVTGEITGRAETYSSPPKRVVSWPIDLIAL